MPKITHALVSSYENITRPVAASVARDVMRFCSIPQSIPVYMPGEFDRADQAGSKEGDSVAIRWRSNRRMIVVVEDTIKQDALLSVITRENEQPPFLEDRRLGFSLRPIYVPANMSLSVRYICATRQEAIRWRDDQAVRRAENRTALAHQIDYSLPLSDWALGLVAHLHQLREGVAGYGDSFAAYFKSVQRAPVHVIGTQDHRAETRSLMIPQRQTAITGWFDFTDIPKETKVDGNSTWEVQFTYNLQYDRCTHYYIAYPLVVHQQHVGADYFDAAPRFGVEELEKNGSIGITALDHMNEWVNNYPQPVGGLRVPYYDDWLPPKANQAQYTVPMMSWMIVLDPNDPQEILDLSLLPDMRFVEEVDTFLRATHQHLTARGRSPLIFTLWCNDIPMDQSLLEIDKHLRVRVNKPLDMRYNYHLRMSFVTNYSLLYESCIMDMKRHAVASLLIYQTVVPMLDVEIALEHLVDGQYLATKYIIWFYQFLVDHGYGCFNQGGHRSQVLGRSRNNANLLESQRSVGSRRVVRDASFYTGSNWRLNTADGGLSSSTGEWLDDTEWYYDESNPDLRHRRRRPKYVQFLAIMTKR